MPMVHPDRASVPANEAPADLPDRENFARLTEPYRRQLKVHCYRMMGSLQDAEDLVQETYLRGWRAFEKFEGRGSVKAWLYQIATRVCLDAIASNKRRQRILPEENFPPTDEPPTGQPLADVLWLDPYPDSELDLIADEAPNAEARYELRESVRLAFIAALQHLPPRQRAILLLVDVLGWSSAETASLLGGSTASVNSALQRARATLERSNQAPREHRPPAFSSEQKALLDGYVLAWESQNIEGLVALLSSDATCAMPPWSQWYVGHESIGRFFGVMWQRCGRARLLATGANGQPAFVLYTKAEWDPEWRAHSVHVLGIQDDCIASMTIFMQPIVDTLLPVFGLPLAIANSDKAPADPRKSYK